MAEGRQAMLDEIPEFAYRVRNQAQTYESIARFYWGYFSGGVNDGDGIYNGIEDTLWYQGTDGAIDPWVIV